MSICCLTVRKEHSSKESTKYIGMNVHKDAISIAVLNSSGKLVMECIIETKAITILEFVHGLRGSLHVTFEEGTWAAELAVPTVVMHEAHVDLSPWSTAVAVTLTRLLSGLRR